MPVFTEVPMLTQQFSAPGHVRSSGRTGLPRLRVRTLLRAQRQVHFALKAQWTQHVHRL